MTDERHDITPPDERLLRLLHARLDGELGPDEARELETRRSADPEADRLARAFEGLNRMAREDRVTAPLGMTTRVLARLSDETPAPAGSPIWLARLFGGRPAAAPAMIRAALLVILALLLARWSVRTPVGPTGSPPAPQTAEIVPHRFEIEAPDARRVCLVGDFNGWKICEAPLRRDPESGRWALQIEIPRGRHEYMFVVDDGWVTDPGADMRIDDGFGNQNAVIYL